MTDTKIIRGLTLRYKGHELFTNHAQGIRDFMKLHQLPGATQVIALTKAVDFDWLDLQVGDGIFMIESRG